MAGTIILTKLDDRADEILDAFAEETGLSATDDGERRRFTIKGSEHELDVVQTLTGIDPDWTDHVGLEEPG